MSGQIWYLSLPTFFLIIFFFLLIIITTRPISAGENNNNINGGGGIGDIAESNPSLSSPSPNISQNPDNNYSPFKPGIIVVVALLTTIFSITFLLLLYAKHCKRRGGVGDGHNLNSTTAAARKNSGIERSVINSLPAFRFGSLRGRKDGLECAVCLNRCETAEVLRLLPKCKHAFHVECLDTWLDAHSTCPLCRYRVLPEDVLIVGDDLSKRDSDDDADIESGHPPPEFGTESVSVGGGVRRVSGRHSSAGEKTSGFDLEIVSQRPGDGGIDNSSRKTASSSRRSLDSFSFLRRKNNNDIDKKSNESVAAVGCSDRSRRKDGMLLTHERSTASELEQKQRRLDHRVIISGGGSHRERWSDPQPSDLLYLRSEMIIGDGDRRYSSSASGSRPSISTSMQGSSSSNRGRQQQLLSLPLRLIRRERGGGDGRSVINSRCTSEITGLNRYPHNTNNLGQRQAGVVSRWRAWISQSLPAVRPDRTAIAA